MTPEKKYARIAGILILLGILVGVFSITPSIDGDNYLREVYPGRKQVFLATIFQSLLIPIYIGFALLLYRVLGKENRPLTLGFVGFRFIAGAFQLIGVMLLPAFVFLSRDYVNSEALNEELYQASGEWLRFARDLMNHVGVILATGLGNLLLYWVFLREKSIPIWLSWFGIMSNATIMLAGYLVAFQQIDVVSIGYGALSIPLIIQEIILAIWLIRTGVRKQEHKTIKLQLS